MSDALFSEFTRSTLHKAGWYPERCVDTKPFEEALVANGYPPISQPVRQFLQEFGGLSIDFHLRAYKQNLSFDVARAADVLYDDGSETEYEGVIGAQSWPIGEMENYWLLIDESGKIYGLFLPHLDLLGNSGYEAIENLLTSATKIVKKLLP